MHRRVDIFEHRCVLDPTIGQMMIGLVGNKWQQAASHQRIVEAKEEAFNCTSLEWNAFTCINKLLLIIHSRP